MPVRRARGAAPRGIMPRGMRRKQGLAGHRGRIRSSGPARRKRRYRIASLPPGRSSKNSKCHRGHTMKTTSSLKKSRKARKKVNKRRAARRRDPEATDDE